MIHLQKRFRKKQNTPGQVLNYIKNSFDQLMSETDNDSFKAGMIAEIKKIQMELKNIKKDIEGKPAKKTTVKKKTIKKKPAKKTIKKKDN